MKVLQIVTLIFVLIGIQVVAGQLPGALGRIEPGQYKQYELQLADGDVSVEEYMELIEERDRPPWGEFAPILKLMREKEAPISRWGYFYAMIENLSPYRAAVIERPGYTADLYSQLKKNIKRLLHAYNKQLNISVEKFDGSIVSVKMHNTNDFTIQIVALLKQYCHAFVARKHATYKSLFKSEQRNNIAE